MITTVLFDLDGTLLPMDQDKFVRAYLKGLCAKAAPHGYEPQKLAESIWAGVGAMVKNTGGKRNEEVFWDAFTAIHGEAARADEVMFAEYYRNEFQLVKEVCGFQPHAKELLARLKVKGLRLVLATNPIFPAIATESRMRWAGIAPEDFVLYTTYENSRFSKPNPEYYRDILRQLGLAPEECLMVGNDVGEDMIAADLGMQVFLLTDCLINKADRDISAYPHGDFEALMAYMEKVGSAAEGSV